MPDSMLEKLSFPSLKYEMPNNTVPRTVYFRIGITLSKYSFEESHI
jgi:hypothetical protein